MHGRALAAYKDAIKTADGNRERITELGDEGAEDAFQLRVHTEMAKSRDKLYLEQGISEADIDETIKNL
mgnify:CR=1 FL=1